MGSMVCKTTGTFIGKCWSSFFIMLTDALFYFPVLYSPRPPSSAFWISFFLRYFLFSLASFHFHASMYELVFSYGLYIRQTSSGFFFSSFSLQHSMSNLAVLPVALILLCTFLLDLRPPDT